MRKFYRPRSARAGARPTPASTPPVPVTALAALLGALAGCAGSPRPVATRPQPAPSVALSPLVPGPRPTPPPEPWLRLIGEYGPPTGRSGGSRLVVEQNGRLVLEDSARHAELLTELSPTEFVVQRVASERMGGPSGERVVFRRDARGRVTALVVGDTVLPRRRLGPEEGSNQLRVTPVRPVGELRAEALAASPPAEPAPERAPDLVELTSLDSTIKLEIRYATTNNFLGTRFYEQARAFLQRPAAEAVVRAHRSLRPLGFGLLIHDAYRPWYVTKMFWDATPEDKKWLVADPAHGSNHNRGAAVDLTLYDLVTGRPVDMPSTYDESTVRAYADYPGGTSLQRWHRALLRRVMEAQGFTVNPHEWWHFDFVGWREYPILNVPFERIGSGR